MTKVPFNVQLLLVLLAPLILETRAICTEGHHRVQTCQNNTWCTNFNTPNSTYRTSFEFCVQLLDTCDNECDHGDRSRYSQDDVCHCTADEETLPTPPPTTVTHTVTSTETAIVERTHSVTTTEIITVLPSSCASPPPSPSCSQGPVPTTTPDTPLPITSRGTNTISMATMGVLTGVLLLALVTVTAGWIWTCVRGRAPAQSLTDTAGDHPTGEADISVEKNEAYGGVVRHTQPAGREYENVRHTQPPGRKSKHVYENTFKYL